MDGTLKEETPAGGADSGPDLVRCRAVLNQTKLWAGVKGWRSCRRELQRDWGRVGGAAERCGGAEGC